MTRLEVHINAQEGSVSVRNDGKGISVAKHDTYPMHVPQLIFGELLTSSNFEDNIKQTVGGRNGFGAKLGNIFSKKFTVEIDDALLGKRYKQTWHDNMSRVDAPILTAYKGSKNSTTVKFWPDFRRFAGMQAFDADTLAVFRRRVLDIAGTTPPSLKVLLNGSDVGITQFKMYPSLFLDATGTHASDNKGASAPAASSVQSIAPAADALALATTNALPRVHAVLDRRWEICVSLKDGRFPRAQTMEVSFVNNIATSRGGTHVAYVKELVCKAIVERIGKMRGVSKDAKELTATDVASHLFLFVNALVVNPTFDSQTKTKLTTKRADLEQLLDPVSKKITKVKIDALETWPRFLVSLAKSGVVEAIVERCTEKTNKKMTKTDGKVKLNQRIHGIPKLEDANKAGQ